VLLCWLAMLLIRVTENEVQKTWFQLKKLLSTIQVGILQLPEGKVQQSNPLNPEQKALFKDLKLELPPKFFNINTQ
ncbi:MAG: transposase, partial [Bacillota bacterium]|nr:transposase [Bacillota bacterium]